MATYLRHTPTGDLYIFTSALAKRKDMELVEEVVDETAAAPTTDTKPKGQGRRKPKAEKVAEVVDDTVDLEDLELDVPLDAETGE